MTDQELLAYCDQYLHYDPTTGFFQWISKPSNNVILNEPLLKAGVNGYRSIRIKRKGYYHHRLAFLIVKGYMPQYIDHIDGDRLNNRIDNLRECTLQQNNWNTGLSITNKSGYKGVSMHSAGKWRARLKYKDKERHLGLFSCKHEAAQAYNKAVIQLRDPNFIYLNEIIYD